ncbi:hypothetical protein D3C78_994330 [compost metagenome]
MQLENQAVVFRQGQVELMQFLQQRHRVQLHETGATLAVFQFGDPQQATETRHQRIGLGQHQVQLHGLRRAFAGLLLHAVKLRAQTGQGRAQVMGDVVAHALDLVHQALDAFEHGVDDGGEHVQFVTPIGQWQAPAQVARDYGFGTGLDPADAAQRPAPQQIPADDARQDGQGHPPEQRVKNDAGHGEQRTVVAHQHQPAAVEGAGRHGVTTVGGQRLLVAVVGGIAIAQHVDLAIEWQAVRNVAQGAAEVMVPGIEQAVGVDAADVEGHADGEGVHQLFTREARKQVLALHQ